MDHRHRPDGPPGDESAGWVVAGEEDRWPPSQPNGNTPAGWSRPGPPPPQEWYAPAHDPGYGGERYGGSGPAGYPQRGYPQPDHPTGGYPEPDYPTGGYPVGRPGNHQPSSGYPPAPPADPYRPEPAYRRVPGASRQRAPERPEQDREPTAPAWLPVLLWTAGLFILPVLLYLGWTLTLSNAAPAGCADATGGACPPPRTEAVQQLVDLLPGVIGALALALLVALGLRRITGDWRDLTVGMAAAVIGAGLATLIGSALG